MIKKIVKILIQLYPIAFLLNKTSRMGRIVSTGSAKIEDVADDVVSKRTDINRATLLASYELLRKSALGMVLDGKYVEFGLSYYGLGVNGLFEGDYPKWDGKVHELYLRATTVADVREALKTVTTEVRGAAYIGIAVNKLLDKESGLYNTRITPGSGVVLTGTKMKIEGKEDLVGIFLTNVETEVETKVVTHAIVVNEPSKVIFITPVDLPLGNYHLSIVSQFSSSTTLLKEPRTYVFDKVLICATGKPKEKKKDPNVANQDANVANVANQDANLPNQDANVANQDAKVESQDSKAESQDSPG